MDIGTATAAVSLQQASTSQKLANSFIKQNAQVGQQIANMVAQGAANASASARGQIVDLSV